jgi:hypothetical protein
LDCVPGTTVIGGDSELDTPSPMTTSAAAMIDQMARAARGCWMESRASARMVSSASVPAAIAVWCRAGSVCPPT